MFHTTDPLGPALWLLLFPAASEGIAKAGSIDVEIQAPVLLLGFHASSHFHPHCGESPAHTHSARIAGVGLSGLRRSTDNF